LVLPHTSQFWTNLLISRDMLGQKYSRLTSIYVCSQPGCPVNIESCAA
jgi:hypothetical protein